MLENFYPTPPALIAKMLDGIKIHTGYRILEPSAGKGDICDWIKESRGRDEYDRYDTRGIEFDVCEINPDLQKILRGKEYRLVCDDFLSFDTYEPYDLIIANFPFSDGDKHLAHALRLLMRSGGQLIALVNAQTIKNPHTQARINLVRHLNDLEAEIQFLQEEFVEAERKTDVEVALIRVSYEKTAEPSIVLEHLKRSIEHEGSFQETSTALAENDSRKAMVARFDLETRAGIKLIDEYHAIKPYILSAIKRKDDSGGSETPLIELKIDDRERDNRSSQVNRYLKGLRKKYWAALIRGPFAAGFTSNIQKELESKLTELRNYDFNLFNIESLENELQTKISAGIEKAILDLFDKLSTNYAWDESIHNGNVHYYNGWKTNKCWKINSKVILPLYLLEPSFSKGISIRYGRIDELTDMVKAFNYLSDTKVTAYLATSRAKEQAEQAQNFTNMDLRYFTLTAYKKGTVHIKFTDQRLLDKLNIFGSQRKAWLPPSYGKKQYEEFNEEERAIVDDFQGREAYEEVVKNADYYLVESARLLQLASGDENERRKEARTKKSRCDS